MALNLLALLTHPELGAAELVHSDRLVFHIDTFNIRRRAVYPVKPSRSQHSTVPHHLTAPPYTPLRDRRESDRFFSPSRTTLRSAARTSATQPKAQARRDQERYTRQREEGGGAYQHAALHHERYAPIIRVVPSSSSSPRLYGRAPCSSVAERV